MRIPEPYEAWLNAAYLRKRQRDDSDYVLSLLALAAEANNSPPIAARCGPSVQRTTPLSRVS